jgi:hypothetical protein
VADWHSFGWPQSGHLSGVKDIAGNGYGFLQRYVLRHAAMVHSAARRFKWRMFIGRRD